jgi:hypothetical protein
VRRNIWVFVAAVLAACSNGNDAREAAPVSELATSPPTTEIGTTMATTAPGSELPVLPDVVSPPWEPETRTDELAIEIAESGEPTAQQVVDALGLLFPEMPGVTPSDLPPGDGLGGTYTLRLASRFRDRLAPEQLAILDAYLESRVLIGTLDADGTVTMAQRASGWRRPQQPISPEEQHMMDLLVEVQNDWRTHVPGLPEHFTWSLSISAVPLDEDAQMETTESADRKVCVVSVSPTFIAASPSDDEVKFVLAHELFHCAQFHWDLDWTAPRWLYDGSADFAAADLYRDDFDIGDELWVNWFATQTTPLDARAYDAWALFENRRRDGGDIYARIEEMFKASEYGHQGGQFGVAQVLALGDMESLLFRMGWSSRSLRLEPWGDEWWLDWPTPAPLDGPLLNAASLVRGVGQFLVLHPGNYTHVQHTVRFEPAVDVVSVTPYFAPLTTRTASGTSTIPEQARRSFCVSPERCVCPDGSEPGLELVNGRELPFSFPAQLDEAYSTVSAEPWDPDRFCADEPEPDTGLSNGDPHLRSFDGLPFDVMTLGEFVLTRDPAGDFEVQTRHEPFGTGAGTSAVAIGTGDHRLTLASSGWFDADPVVRADGVETTESVIDLGDATATVDGTTVTVAWSDGTTVTARFMLGWIVDIAAPRQRTAGLEGLLGAADGNMFNDLRMPDGTTVDDVAAAEPESAYALSWAVDQGSTLFDYEPGESPATFRMPHPQPGDGLVGGDIAETCRMLLGEAATSFERDACAFDVTVTGDRDFVAVHASIVEQRTTGEVAPVELVRPEPARPQPAEGDVATARAGEPTLTLSGTEGYVEGFVDVPAGSVLFARAEVCLPGVAVEMRVLDIDRDEEANAAVCGPTEAPPGVEADEGDEWVAGESAVWLGGDGQHAIEVTWRGDGESFVAVELFTDPSPTIVDADGLADGETTVLSGIGDTVVYLVPPGPVDIDVDLDGACAREMALARGSTGPERPMSIDFCEGYTHFHLTPTDVPTPFVVFNRTAGEAVVELAAPEFS